MNVVITGGGGFLGQRVARTLLERGGLAPEPGAPRTLTRITLLDRTLPVQRVESAAIEYLAGDIGDKDVLARAFRPDTDAVFHLASVVSAGAESDFDLGYRVNLEGMRNTLEAVRALPRPARLVFASSVAAFGGDLPDVVVDATAPRPQSSYGTQKVIGELLVSDYSRKGYLDGRTIRLPTIVVRPGKPNRAASGFMSGILREPLNGEASVCPVPPGACMWILSPQRAVDALIHAIELPGEAWGWDRVLNAQGITVSVESALAALGRAAGPQAVARVRFERDPAIERIVLGWPARFASERAKRLGFRGDASIDEIVAAHLQTLAGDPTR